MPIEPHVPSPLTERGGPALQWEALRERLAAGARSELGRSLLLALQPSAELPWVEEQQSRNDEMRRLVAGGNGFEFRGIFDPEDLLAKARIESSALEPGELLRTLELAERADAWRRLLLAPPDAVREKWPSIAALSEPVAERDLANLLRFLRGKIESDGSLADDASPELARIRRALGRQHRAIEDSLRRALARLSDDGSTQDALITVRGERFVIPVKAEFKRRAGGVVHGSSSSGATVFVEPLETIEENNELIRLLDEEQGEVHRILAAMTRAVAGEAEALLTAAAVLAQVDAHQAAARFAEELDCVRPVFAAGSPGEGAADGSALELRAARHPLLDLRLRASAAEGGSGRIVPLDIALPAGVRQMIVSGPNTGGKTVVLKTAGLLALMAQSGLPVPARAARLPLFAAIYADVGDAQSIEQNLSTFSAHVVNVNRVARSADGNSLVLLDELGSATDPEEGAALASAVAEHFLHTRAWCLITTHLTALKVYGAKHDGVLNAAVGFDEVQLAPTYDLRLGVPGASAGLNIAARLGLDPVIVAHARGNLSTQQADIARFLDELHAGISATQAEREQLAATERKLASERAHLQAEGRAEQKQRTRELERKLQEMIGEFEDQLRETVRAIDDKKVAAKIQRDAAVRLGRLRRESTEQFQTTILTHTNGADGDRGHQGAQKEKTQREPQVGDLVTLRSLGSEGRVTRVIDAKTLEVGVGAMKMRVARGDIAAITPVREPAVVAPKRSGGVSVFAADTEGMGFELNVIGRSADEAEEEVSRFVERAFLAGMPRIRVVHGVGMGVLRRTLREYLRKHPHVTAVTEPPYNEGGQGVTLVELKQ